MAREWFFLVLLNSSSFSAILQPSALFVQLVDGAAAIAQLVQQVLDLIGQVLVLAADNVQLLVGLVQGGLEAEALGVEVAALGLAGLKLGLHVVGLGLPLADHLLEVLAALLGDDGGGVGALVLHGQLLQLVLHAVLGLLGGGNLGVEGLDVLLGLGHALGQLVLAGLELVDAAHGLGLELGAPQLDLGLGLGEGAEHVVLLLSLLVDLHAQVLGLGVEVLVLGEQGGAVAGLTVGQPLGVLQLGGEGGRGGFRGSFRGR